MAFKLGNFSIKEIIFASAEDFNGNLLYTLDQLTDASIEVSSDPTEVTDKFGNIIRQIYNNKTATFTATSALLSPVLLNAGSGSDAIIAGTGSDAITMPKIITIAPGSTVDVSDALDGTIQVMGIYNNGANGAVLQPSATAAVVDQTYAFDDTTKQLTVPSETTDAPTKYFIQYKRNVEEGMKLINRADKFPDTVRLTLYVALMDPCDGQYKAGYVYLPSFTADPSVTINLDVNEQTTSFQGNINLDFCGTEKILYEIYLPSENAVVSGN